MALVVDVIAVVLLLMFTDLGIYALLVAMIIYAIVVCVMNDIFMKKYLDYRNPWKTAYVSPIIASVVMGVVAAGVYYGLHAIVPSNIICLGVSIILAAAATDFLDGRIARSFNQISRIGRLLDPLADKAMQAVMLACLMSRYPLVKLVLILFAVKETYMLVMGWKVMMETEATGEAQWHGKLNTAVSYVVVMVLTAGVRLPYSTANVLIGACAVCMAMSFAMYASEFRQILERKNGLMGPKIRRNSDGRDWI